MAKERDHTGWYFSKKNRHLRKITRNGLIYAEGVYDDLIAFQVNDAYNTYPGLDLSNVIFETSRELQKNCEKTYGNAFLDSVNAPEMSLKEARALVNSRVKWDYIKGCDRLNALKVVLYETCGDLGIDPPKLYGTLGKNTGGVKLENNAICVDLYESGPMLVQMVKHEAFHAYQAMALEGRLNKGAPKPSAAKLVEWGRTYIEPKEGKFRYRRQPMEADATAFALQDMLNKNYRLGRRDHKDAKRSGFVIKNGVVIQRPEKIKRFINKLISPAKQDSSDLERIVKVARAEGLDETLLGDRMSRRQWLEKIRRERTAQGRQMDPVGDLATEIENRFSLESISKGITHALPNKR